MCSIIYQNYGFKGFSCQKSIILDHSFKKEELLSSYYNYDFINISQIMKFLRNNFLKMMYFRYIYYTDFLYYFISQFIDEERTSNERAFR